MGRNCAEFTTGLFLSSFVTVFFVGMLLIAPAPVAASEPAPDTTTTNFEVKFMENMIDHHAMAIEMAALCLEKAIHEELRNQCEEIIATQRQEIETMQAWLLDWYGITYEPQMNNGAMKQMERMGGLDGEEFEIAFMEEMIKHHEKAIREGERCVDRAYHEELVSMCEDIITIQTAEIALMRDWLCAWYSICQ